MDDRFVRRVNMRQNFVDLRPFFSNFCKSGAEQKPLASSGFLGL